jgi:hypothetical protein
MDLSRLSGALKPAVVVTAADLARAGIRVFPFYAGDLLCPIGKTRSTLASRSRCCCPRPSMRLTRRGWRCVTRRSCLSVRRPVRSLPNYPAFRFTRVGGPTPDAPDVYSPLKTAGSVRDVSIPAGARSVRNGGWATSGAGFSLSAGFRIALVVAIARSLRSTRARRAPVHAAAPFAGHGRGSAAYGFNVTTEDGKSLKV